MKYIFFRYDIRLFDSIMLTILHQQTRVKYNVLVPFSSH